MLGVMTSLRRAEHDAEALLRRERPASRVLFHGEAADAILHDDHRAIDDDAEVERAEAHQVCAHLVASPCP